MTTCSIDRCENGGKLRRGWCGMHYTRWRTHGDPDATLSHTDPEGAFLARTEPIVGDPGCIIWTGATNRDGYGRLRVNGRMVYAHRYAWEREHGPIPDGMVIDHRCFERSCVNAEHLRPATVSQNNANRSGANKGRKHDLPRGVTRQGRGYTARVQQDGQDHYLGMFGTPEEASAAASEARRIHFGIYAGNA